ncbi:MAG: TnsA endonuclease N-terminal domain-containing protein [Burkholderiaceae bacterium]
MTTTLWNGSWRGRAPSGEPHTRSRQVIRPSGGIMRSKFPSRKNGRLVHCEGILELDAAHLFELHPRVARYREQPAAVMFPDRGRLRRYTPDFEVELVSGKTIQVEVKPEASLLDAEVRHKLQMVGAHMRRLDKAFVVLTDVELRRQPRQANARSISRNASRVPPSQAAATAAVSTLSSALPVTLGVATALCEAEGRNIFSLLQLGLLRCDLDAPLTADTPIHTISEADDGWFCLSQEHDF